MKAILGKIAFGSVFMLLLPAVLVLWAKGTEEYISLPVPQHAAWIFFPLYAGSMLLMMGMYHLYTYGKGLPMNAYPPKFFVSRGVYSICAHPIYAGAVCISFGLSVLFQSSSAFWLVTPSLLLMAVAYVYGYEQHHIAAIFGQQAYTPLLALPQASDQAVLRKDRLRIWLLGLIPWLLVYETFIWLGPAPDAYVVYPEWPLIPQSVVFYLLVYVQVLLLPFFIQTQHQARTLIEDIWLLTFAGAFIYFLVPVKVDYLLLTADDLWSNLIATDRSYDSGAAALPSFHVIWALLCARYYSIRFGYKAVWYSVALLICISCVTTGNHSFADVVAGLVVYSLVHFKRQWIQGLQAGSEKIANSWKEWRLGSVRIINHGLYAAVCGFITVIILAGFLDEAYTYAGAMMCMAGITGAALWAQWVEGSDKLLRPFGYYGSVVGAGITALVFMLVFPISPWVLLSAVAMLAPWVQVAGRFRCLVQGCCHGKECRHAQWAIHFHHEKSRVNKISELRGKPLYPTQLFSIFTNLLLGLILIRLYQLQMPANFITGIYLLGNSLSRFVEESYRGEAQTPYYSGLRLYQWMALIFLIMGILFTMIPSQALPTFTLHTAAWYWSAFMALFAGFAYGVDFPLSNRRFARLTADET